jgi:hypothetical protein
MESIPIYWGRITDLDGHRLIVFRCPFCLQMHCHGMGDQKPGVRNAMFCRSAYYDDPIRRQMGLSSQCPGCLDYLLYYEATDPIISSFKVSTLRK